MSFREPQSPKTLSETGFKIGDIVLFSSDKESTGGVLFQIVEDTEPVKVAGRYNRVDENGKKVSLAAMHGFVRIKPLFEFFATPKGKEPKGKGATLIIYYESIERNLKPVDLVLLGTKYLELGNIMRDIARLGGMVSADANE